MLAGGIHGGNNLSVGFASGPGQSIGTALVDGGISVSGTVSVGRIDDGGSGLASGDATGTLKLVNGGLTAIDFRVGTVDNGSGIATGALRDCESIRSPGGEAANGSAGILPARRREAASWTR